MSPRLPTTLAALLLFAGCAGESATSDPTAVERSVLGDTTVVLSHAPTLWPDTMTLVEELRIGVFEGEDVYQFGFITNVAVDDAGGIWAFDQQVPALRYYDAEGQYVRTAGGEGQGPGEYRDAALGLVIRSDGRLVMRDPRNGRLNVYEPDGTPSDAWRVDSGLFTGDATSIDDRDHLYLKILTGEIEQNRPWPIGLLHLDENGEVVDSIIPPTLPGEPDDPGGAFTVAKTWSVANDGGLLIGITDRYRIEHRRRDGSVLRIARDVERPRVHPDERAAYEARNDWMMRTQGQFRTSDPVPVPEIKPAWRSAFQAEDGRIWVTGSMPSTRIDPAPEPSEDPNRPPPIGWREPRVFDVHAPDGAWLGTVLPPSGLFVQVVRGDLVWGTMRGEFGETYIVRMRVGPRAAEATEGTEG